MLTCKENAVILEHFGEVKPNNMRSLPCCDVCEELQQKVDYSSQVQMIVETVDELPSVGEKKVHNDYFYYRCYTNAILILRLPVGFVDQVIFLLQNSRCHHQKHMVVEGSALFL